MAFTVFVGGAKAVDANVTSAGVVFTVPPGSGRGNDVRVVFETVFGVVDDVFNAAVDYAAPVVDSIKGCPVAGCAIDGNDTITVSGTNFGPDGTAVVLVDGNDCSRDADSRPKAT